MFTESSNKSSLESVKTSHLTGLQVCISITIINSRHISYVLISFSRSDDNWRPNPLNSLPLPPFSHWRRPLITAEPEQLHHHRDLVICFLHFISPFCARQHGTFFDELGPLVFQRSLQSHTCSGGRGIFKVPQQPDSARDNSMGRGSIRAFSPMPPSRAQLGNLDLTDQGCGRQQLSPWARGTGFQGN